MKQKKSQVICICCRIIITERSDNNSELAFFNPFHDEILRNEVYILALPCYNDKLII